MPTLGGGGGGGRGGGWAGPGLVVLNEVGNPSYSYGAAMEWTRLTPIANSVDFAY